MSFITLNLNVNLTLNFNLNLTSNHSAKHKYQIIAKKILWVAVVKELCSSGRGNRAVVFLECCGQGSLVFLAVVFEVFCSNYGRL
jgi:hypothetical protein